MNEQQEHLKNFLEQSVDLEKKLDYSRESYWKEMSANRELFWKVQGAIEYLTELGVSLPESEEDGSGVVEEEA
jgi:hypothetical protein